MQGPLQATCYMGPKSVARGFMSSEILRTMGCLIPSVWQILEMRLCRGICTPEQDERFKCPSASILSTAGRTKVAFFYDRSVFSRRKFFSSSFKMSKW